MNARDRDLLRRLNVKAVRAYTVTEDHLASLIDFVATGHAHAYEVDGGIWIAITDAGREAAGLFRRPDPS